ncbi:hypothetical protein EG68_06090 [Paragonimus skrjabini miyazakii]|uniref:Uncharacterized protein n=1 Tax=Paragonimus skrjabini miyazakii TaxID=59628 RepID=A0A8S9YW77_9TREM|nr:hypothetical protein EG68_06090 [Paragonimus skrjabini miyazakii]
MFQQVRLLAIGSLISVLLALHFEGSILAVPVIQHEQQQPQQQQQQPQEQQQLLLPRGDVQIETNLKEDVVDPKKPGAQLLEINKNAAEPANENMIVQLMQEQKQVGNEQQQQLPQLQLPPPAQKNEDTRPDEKDSQEKQQQQQQKPEQPVQPQQQNDQQKPPEQQLQLQPQPNEKAEHAPPPMPPSHDENVREPVVDFIELPKADQDEAKRIENKGQESSNVQDKHDLNGVPNDQQKVENVLDDKVEHYHRIANAENEDVFEVAGTPVEYFLVLICLVLIVFLLVWRKFWYTICINYGPKTSSPESGLGRHKAGYKPL